MSATQRPKNLEYWFDFASTYSYLTSMRIVSICQKREIQLLWRPFLLGPLFKEQGWSTSPFNIYPAEGAYMWKEMERYSKRYGLSHYKKPSLFPRNGLLASRVSVAAQDAHWLGAFIQGVFRANFEEDRDIATKEEVSKLLEAVGADSKHWLSEAENNEVKLALRERTDRARSLGIFGAPSFIVNGELFWGDNRLEEACEWATSP
jgi:2-hydroxychromene-2-carboxylate isomerase